MKNNSLKEKLRAGQVVVGTYLFIPSPTIMEILGYAGFDYVIIDTEHSPTGSLDAQTLENIVRAADVSGVVPLVRLPERSRIMTQKALDAGAMGIEVPWVKTREDVENAVKDAKYPPEGHRGCCYLTRGARYSSDFTPDYWSDANRNTMVVPLIEKPEAVENLEDILSVDGIDFVSFGARDYSMSLGYPIVDNPETNRAREHVLNVCNQRGIPLGRFLYPPFDKSVKEAISEGFRVLVIGGDVSLLYHTTSEIVNIVRREA